MNNLRILVLVGCTAIFCTALIYAVDFPANVKGTAEKPLVLLELGKQPASAAEKDNAGVKVYAGEVSSHMGDEYVSVENDEVIAAKKGFDEWIVNFRFKLEPKPKAGDYNFYAKWKQGGDPAACPQTFAVYAGNDPDKLEERGSFVIKYSTGWQYEWGAGGAVKIKDADTIIEVRNSGKGHDAKVFDSFLLVPK